MSNPVLIINEGCSDNLGDQAINNSLQLILSELGYTNLYHQDFTKIITAPISLATPKNNHHKYWRDFIYMIIPSKIIWLFRNILRIKKASSKKYKFVVIGGGQLVLSNKYFAIAMASWVLCLRFFGNNKILLFGVGCGSRFKFLDKYLFRYALKNFSDIYVRDTASRDILKNNFHLFAHVVSDVAFWQTKITVHNIKKGLLLGVVDFHVYKIYNVENISREQYFEKWITLVEKSGYLLVDAKLFYTTIADKLESIKFQRYVLQTRHITLPIIYTDNIDKLIHAIIKSDVMIAGRMHALIFALIYDTEWICFELSDKLRKFVKDYSTLFDLDVLQNKLKQQLLQAIKLL